MGVIKKQGIINTIITYLGIFIGFINLIFVQPHYLQPDELGLTRVLFSFSAVIAMFLPLGIGSIAVKYFPFFKDHKTKHHGFFGLMLLFACIGFLLIATLLFTFKGFIIGEYVDKSRLFTDYFVLILPLCFMISLVSLFGLYCQSLFKSSFPALLNEVIIRLLQMGLIFVYYSKAINLSQFIYCFVGIYALQVFILLLYIFTIDKPGIKIDFSYFKEYGISKLLKYGLLLSFTSLASLGIKYIDLIMIGKYLPLAYAGIYSVAAFIPTIIEAPVAALERISNAKIAHEWAGNNTEEIKKIYYQSAKYLLLFGGILFLGVNININYLFALLPKDYSSAVNIVLVLSLSTLFNMVTGLNGGIIFNSDNYIYGSYMLFILFALSFINNIIFIPMYGLIGAAIATSLSSLIFNVMKYLFIWYKFKMQPFGFHTLYVIGLIVVCLFLNKLIPDTNNPYFNIGIHSAFVITIYGLASYFLNIVPEFHRYIPFIKQKNA